MRFTDPRHAGRELSAQLEMYRGHEHTVVIAIARGGVAVGLEAAKHLGLPLDLVLLRRLLVPHGPDAPVCAFNVGGVLFVDQEIATLKRDAPDPALEHFVADALTNLARDVRACRNERPPLDLARKTVLLIDNGIRTGSTMRAAVRALRSQSPSRIVAAVPVAAVEARAGIEAVTDNFVCLASPAPFGHVGLWYADFKRSSDDEIRGMLAESERVDDKRAAPQ